MLGKSDLRKLYTDKRGNHRVVWRNVLTLGGLMPSQTITENPEMFEPGTHGCHEAFHVASILMAMVDEQLCQHPSVQMNPQWQNFADIARENLFALYQSIGRVHTDSVSQRRAVDYYENEFFEERDCDHCGKPYRGPAVYCSLTCAQADA